VDIRDRFIRAIEPEPTAGTLGRPGGREAYVRATLPASDPETGDALDYSDASFTQLNDCASAVATLWDDHNVALNDAVAELMAHEADYSPAYMARKLAEVRDTVGAATVTKLAKVEALAGTAEAEAAELEASIAKADKVDPAQASLNQSALVALTPDARRSQLRGVAETLVDPTADAQTKYAARRYIASALAINPFAGIVDELTRAFLLKVMQRTANPAAVERVRHLRLAARSIRESADRVRSLIASRADSGARPSR